MKKLFILTLAVFTAFSTFLVKGPAIEASVEYKEVDGYGELESPIVEKINNIYKLENGKCVTISGTTVTELELESPIASAINYAIYKLENGKYVTISGTTVTELELESPIVEEINNIYKLENGKYVQISGSTVTELELESPIVSNIGLYYKLENGKDVQISGTTVTEIQTESPIKSYIGGNVFELENEQYVQISSTGHVSDIEFSSKIANKIYDYVFAIENGKYAIISVSTSIKEFELESPIESHVFDYVFKLQNGKYAIIHNNGVPIIADLKSPVTAKVNLHIYVLENGSIVKIVNGNITYYREKISYHNNILKGNGFILDIKFMGNNSEVYKFYYPDSRNPYPDWERDGNDYYYYTGKLGNSYDQGDHLVIESPNGLDLEYIPWQDVNAGTLIWRKFKDYNELIDPDNPDYTKVALLLKTESFENVEVKTLKFYRPSSIADDVITYEQYDFVMATQSPQNQFDIIQIRVPLTYDVTYYVDSELYETQRVNAGLTLIPPTAPEKENYVFVGWYEDPETQIPFDRNNAIDQQTSLYAKFVPKSTGSTIVPGEDKPFDFMIPINIILMGGLAVLLVVAYKKKGKRR